MENELFLIITLHLQVSLNKMIKRGQDPQKNIMLDWNGLAVILLNSDEHLRNLRWEIKYLCLEYKLRDSIHVDFTLSTLSSVSKSIWKFQMWGNRCYDQIFYQYFQFL